VVIAAIGVGSHYDAIMSKTRQISITLPEDLIETIKAAVARGEARSVSSYIASRLAPGVIMDALFAEWDADRGAPSAEVSAWAERELDRAFGEQRSRIADAGVA
jgi:Arc/MetJ-type ribon-helix-helix transcriptional regulator